MIERIRTTKFWPIWLLLLPLVLLLIAVACGDDDGGGTGTQGNLFADPSFEGDFDASCRTDSLDCWFSLKAPNFTISDAKANSGSSSALLEMREGAGSDLTKVFYLVQEVSATEFPEVISGSYFVENWVPGTEKQYLQFVVIVFGGGENLPVCPGGGTCPNYQIRYLLAGIDEEPFEIANAKFVFLETEDPVQGEWVHFERNLEQDFIDLWGGTPNGADKIRVLFEVRYDAKDAAEGPIEADVYYDDLYMGSAR